MPTYEDRVRANVLPLSQSQDLDTALKEWVYRNETDFSETGDFVCGYCDKKKLKYHFRVQNKHTLCDLWIGSECIEQYGVSYRRRDLLSDMAELKSRSKKEVEKSIVPWNFVEALKNRVEPSLTGSSGIDEKLLRLFR